MQHHIFGIRHHGPGSARSMLAALNALEPDVVLVEGPPDADALIPLAAQSEMVPPVALLIFLPESPRRAVSYPFAQFSPEWQAIRYALERNIPVRFMDLPQSHMLAQPEQPEDAPSDSPEPRTLNPEPSADPFRWIAEAAGYTDSERWWEQMVEQRRDSRDLFAAILELMTALRAEYERRPAEDEDENEDDSAKTPERLNARTPEDLLREAWMRQTIRAAAKEEFRRAAVVCGAWHGPALAELGPAKRDADLLKGLPKVKTAATWIPWTYDRLTWLSGYGAGIQSPGYYDTLWHHPHDVAIRFMGRVTHLLRSEDLDASPASAIEAVRLADALSALRGRSLPGLGELIEAAQATLCGGDEAPVRLIARKLVVGERLGAVPADAPAVPLQQDLEREQRRLRLPPEASERVLDLDLRKPNEMDRSRLLHRLGMLGITWGVQEQVTGKLGTFHELWRLRWEPEMAVQVIEAGIWGNTLLAAATSFAVKQAVDTTSLSELTALVQRALLADLPNAIGPLLKRLEDLAGATSDVPVLMDAVPALSGAARYGNVRGIDTPLVAHVLDELVTRICVGLPAACSALNDEAAEEMFKRVLACDSALGLHRNEQHLAAWRAVLTRLADQHGLHGLIAGRACRLLTDATVWPPEEAARRMGLALSRANPPSYCGAWIEGFLTGSGLLLLHREELWTLLDGWVDGLRAEDFLEQLPIVRRTFATFSAPERRQMGERAARGRLGGQRHEETEELDSVRVSRVLPTLARLMGLTYEEADR